MTIINYSYQCDNCLKEMLKERNLNGMVLNVVPDEDRKQGYAKMLRFDLCDECYDTLRPLIKTMFKNRYNFEL